MSCPSTAGSPYSSTSIRNNFSQYGSLYRTYSACNQFASSPPRVFNGDGSIYYGELTLNQASGPRRRGVGVVSGRPIETHN